MTNNNVTFVNTQESEYIKQFSDFFRSHNCTANDNLGLEEDTIFNIDMYKIKNKYPVLFNFYEIFNNVNLSHYINKSLVVVDVANNTNTSTIIKNLLLQTKPQKNTRELFLTDINNVIVTKDESINIFKRKYDSFLKTPLQSHKVDIINPNFNKLTNHGVNTSIHISDILLTPIIQFPRIFEYIHIHENRELIEFLLKYVKIYNSFSGGYDNNDKHFYTLCFILSRKNKGIHDDHQTLSFLKDMMGNLDPSKYESIDDYKFDQVLDPFTKFPQVIRMNEYDLKQLFGKMSTNFKKDYSQIETFIKSVDSINTNNKLFLEHFLKISLLLKFIVSQIINITYRFECKNYNKDSKVPEIIEFPDFKEFEILNTLVSKVLCLKDFYKISTNEIVYINKNNIFSKTTGNTVANVHQGACKKTVPKTSQGSMNLTNGFNSSYNPSIDGLLDPMFFINWIVPVLNKFFRINYELPNFYLVDKFDVKKFNASFKNEHYVSILSLNVYKKLIKADDGFLQKSKIDNVFLITNENVDNLINTTERFYVFNDIKSSVDNNKIWREHLISELKTLENDNETLNNMLEAKMEDLDHLRFNKIPNLINGKFDEKLNDNYTEDSKLFVEREVTSHDNKTINTKSLYYKYFEDESSVTNDMNVKTLKMRLEKNLEQVSSLEKRLFELKERSYEAQEDTATAESNVSAEDLKRDEELMSKKMLELQEQYKEKSNEAFTKATTLSKLKDYLKSREKFLEVLRSEENKVLKKKDCLLKTGPNMKLENYQSLLSLLKAKHDSMLTE
ncbi:hypothetical protein ACO0R3_001143 [Hanseniaspora guilliermondii]